jgi:hypothetical protein
MHTRVAMKRKRSTFDRKLLSVGLGGETRSFRGRDLMLDIPISWLPVMHSCVLWVLLFSLRRDEKLTFEQELAAITDDSIYSDMRSSDYQMGRWTIEDPSLRHVQRWVRARR